MGVIIVTDRSGVTHELEAIEGWRVMEILRDYKVGIEGTCGGACSCATCHVIVDEAWVPKLHPARDEETEMLDQIPVLHDTSRLACQIIWDDSLDGLKLTIAQD
ncbi:MAG: 2Fe-2S iron-sulfur cluster-binding protein [Hyphomicrobiales bacterium]|nr:2Fe-2S iron-sulfur cluster-binding protein [Hyphomicrobiales bacterium]